MGGSLRESIGAKMRRLWYGDRSKWQSEGRVPAPGSGLPLCGRISVC